MVAIGGIANLYIGCRRRHRFLTELPGQMVYMIINKIKLRPTAGIF